MGVCDVTCELTWHQTVWCLRGSGGVTWDKGGGSEAWLLPQTHHVCDGIKNLKAALTVQLAVHFVHGNTTIARTLHIHTLRNYIILGLVKATSTAR